MKSKTKSLTVLAVIILLLALPMVISAEHPYVRIDPAAPNNAVVDGNENEWTRTPTDGTNPDWFSYTCTGNGGGAISCETAKIYGDLFMRFNCTTKSLFFLMYADRGQPYIPNSAGGDNWIAMPDQSNKVLTPSMPGWADLADGKGFEAVLTKDNNNQSFVPGKSYTMNIHSTMKSTSGTGDTLVTLPTCDNVPTAVSLQTFAASAKGGSSFPALPVLGVGMVALAAVVVVRRPRK